MLLQLEKLMAVIKEKNDRRKKVKEAIQEGLSLINEKISENNSFNFPSFLQLLCTPKLN